MRCSHAPGTDKVELKTFICINIAKTVYIIPCRTFNENGKRNKILRFVSHCQSFLQLSTTEQATDRISIITTSERTALPFHFSFPSMTLQRNSEFITVSIQKYFFDFMGKKLNY